LNRFSLLQTEGPSEWLETPPTIKGLNGNETMEGFAVGGDPIKYHNQMMIDG